MVAWISKPDFKECCILRHIDTYNHSQPNIKVLYNLIGRGWEWYGVILLVSMGNNVTSHNSFLNRVRMEGQTQTFYSYTLLLTHSRIWISSIQWDGIFLFSLSIFLHEKDLQEHVQLYLLTWCRSIRLTSLLSSYHSHLTSKHSLSCIYSNNRNCLMVGA